MIHIAILGFGVVGSGSAEVLTQNRELIAKHCGEEVNIKYILDLREFPDHPLGERVVHDIRVILDDPEVALVAEMMGGAHPAYDFTRAAIEAGKHVVTSNKEVVATFGVELLKLARKHHVSYLFEASVGGGIPIIRPLQTDLASNQILSVSGILNGTTNFILTKMEREGADFASALKEAQANGYAEANPAADVEGLDAARKIVILAALAFGVLLDPNKISTTGITGITKDHTAAARALGGAVKLIGHTRTVDGKVLAMVSPFFVPSQNPVSHVDGVFNGILVDANMLGRALFYGAGAGKLPTASAVVADIIDILSHRAEERSLPQWRTATAEEQTDASVLVCRHLFLIEGCAKCADKATKALRAEACVGVEGGRYALISAPMTAKEARDALSELTVVLTVPVLD
ncbi:MAG: homoserine dehydrogenase [Clostridia bacterium]|nr:homoserine dehydrogenase [Clostridia bacterium]MBR2926084.1 homoserine dehydrogenase [Clostridia bacterium]